MTLPLIRCLLEQVAWLILHPFIWVFVARPHGSLSRPSPSLSGTHINGPLPLKHTPPLLISMALVQKPTPNSPLIPLALQLKVPMAEIAVYALPLEELLQVLLRPQRCEWKRQRHLPKHKPPLNGTAKTPLPEPLPRIVKPDVQLSLNLQFLRCSRL